MAQTSDPAPMRVYLLGTVEFADMQRLQRRLVYDLGEQPGAAVVLCEHPPTLTIGRSGSRARIRLDDQELRDRGLPVHWVNRGGGCQLHVPGQLAAYVVINLRERDLLLNQHVEALHQSLLAVISEFDLKGHRRPGCSGVFLDRARVASVGVAVNRWIAYHGLTLNVGPYLGPFHEVIEEIGPDGAPIRQTSLEARRQRPAPMARARETLLRQLAQAYGLVTSHVYTTHPMIRPKVRPHELLARHA